MLFTELAPLVAERPIHLLISPGPDGKVIVFIQPSMAKDKAEDAAFVTPLRLQATPQELDQELPDLLRKWISTRQEVTQSLQESLAASERAIKDAADATRKAAAEKVVKRTAASGTKTTSVVAKCPVPQTADAPAKAKPGSETKAPPAARVEAATPTPQDELFGPAAS